MYERHRGFKYTQQRTNNCNVIGCEEATTSGPRVRILFTQVWTYTNGNMKIFLA